MNYDTFRALWHETLSAAGLSPFIPWPTETIDVRGMNRTYSIYVSPPGLRSTRPFTLNATLPYDAPLPMPDAGTWQRWTECVTRRLEPLVPAEVPIFEEEGQETILFWRGGPEARLQCRPGGQLVLTGVELPSWQGIELPRQWDNPDRPPDEDTEEQLESLFEWVRTSLQVWTECLPHLKAA